MKNVIRKETIIIKNVQFGGIGIPEKFQFPDNENLRNVKLWGIQTFYLDQQGANAGQLFADPDYNIALIPQDVFQNCYLTLKDKKNVNFLKRCPFVIFQTIENGGIAISSRYDPSSNSIVEKDHKVLSGQLLDLNNSYVELATNGLKPFEAKTIVINFYYSRIDLEKVTMKKQKLTA
jgi:hypothetical protein